MIGEPIITRVRMVIETSDGQVTGWDIGGPANDPGAMEVILAHEVKEPPIRWGVRALPEPPRVTTTFTITTTGGYSLLVPGTHVAEERPAIGPGRVAIRP